MQQFAGVRYATSYGVVLHSALHVARSPFVSPLVTEAADVLHRGSF